MASATLHTAATAIEGSYRPALESLQPGGGRLRGRDEREREREIERERG